jgi:hypothetical protein
MPLAAFVLPPTVHAQGVTGGLFGATRSDTVNRDRLQASATVTEALDSDLPPSVANEFPQGPLQSGGLWSMVLGSAEYAHTRRRLRFSANGETAVRYYNRLNSLDVLGHTGALGADISLADNANLLVSQAAAYAPSYLFELFPATGQAELGDLIPIAPDYRLLQTNSYTYRSHVELGAGSLRRARFTASGSYDRTDFRAAPTGEGERPRLNTYSARAGVQRAVRRNGRLSGEYEYRTGDFSVGRATEHRFAFGGEYSRALSSSRRATVRVQLTPSTLTVPEAVFTANGDADPAATGRLFRLQGDATVEYQPHLRWIVSGSYRRGVEYLAILGVPVLSDGARVSVEGLLTRRLQLTATVASVNGASAIDQLSRLDSSTANARLRYAFTRMFAVYGEYVYVAYDFGQRETLAPQLPRAFDQHGLRVGIMLWKPVF